MYIKCRARQEKVHVVIGRDARISGRVVRDLVVAALNSAGVDVTDLGLSTTPTVEMAVTGLRADGGIIITASHNPAEWNALKLLNADGEFLRAEDGKKVLSFAESSMEYAGVHELGTVQYDDSWLRKHIRMILGHPLVDVPAIKKADFSIAVDPVNSCGAMAVPQLLSALGITKVHLINGSVDGDFAHNPEPLPEHLADLSRITKEKADLGIAVDPDVDRLALICENGKPFGEEYTLVAVADYVLQSGAGNTVSNLSSTRALGDITERAGGRRYTSAVGEVNVVEKMKEVGAVIGGEGNGGVIVPSLHYGRDALAGIALFLSHLARSGMTASELRATYPDYFISKNKIALPGGIDVDSVLDRIASRFPAEKVSRVDGVWVERDEAWVHLRKSNTEPIIRIYAESGSHDGADALAAEFRSLIEALFAS